jgi:predicted metalloprotease with PDZ domain
VTAAGTTPPQTELAYRFQLEREPVLSVRVRLALRGAPDGATDLEVSRSWGGVDTGGDDVLDVGVVDSQGRALEVEHPEPNLWRVHHAPDESLQVDYHFEPNEYQSDPSPDVNRRPILNAGLFHFLGHLGLVLPKHLEGDERRRVAFSWEGFAAAGWNVATSFGVGPEEYRVEARTSELAEAVYMAGDFRLLRRDVRGRPVHVAIQGKEWGFTDDAFADLASGVVGLERGFFDDFDYPYYLIALIAVGHVSPGTTSLGGSGLTKSFALAMLPGTKLDDDFARNRGVKGLLAHEMFHNWNGRVIERLDPEELVYWFSEGFTDFYARRLLYRGGLITREEYAGSLNRTLADLFTSPVREAPNERIRADFWRDRDVKRLPYLRGEVVAQLLDQALRHASGGRRNLDDFMRDLVRDARRGERISTASLLQRLRHQAGAETAERIRLVVEQGALPALDSQVLEPCLEMRVEPVRNFDLGFDYERSQHEHVVCGLRPSSKAAEAGLRDGQKILGWSVHFGDAEKPVTLRVRDDQGERGITYVPAGDSTPVPHFSLRPGAGQAECRCL